jgi:hypothetical protein
MSRPMLEWNWLIVNDDRLLFFHIIYVYILQNKGNLQKKRIGNVFKEEKATLIYID